MTVIPLSATSHIVSTPLLVLWAPVATFAAVALLPLLVTGLRTLGTQRHLRIAAARSGNDFFPLTM